MGKRTIPLPLWILDPTVIIMLVVANMKNIIFRHHEIYLLNDYGVSKTLLHPEISHLSWGDTCDIGICNIT